MFANECTLYKPKASTALEATAIAQFAGCSPRDEKKLSEAGSTEAEPAFCSAGAAVMSFESLIGNMIPQVR